MTSEDILMMAREAGAAMLLEDTPAIFGAEAIERFAALVAAAAKAEEREACAKVCEAFRDKFSMSCAAAIRARRSS